VPRPNGREKIKKVLFVNDAVFNLEIAHAQLMGLGGIEKQCDFVFSGIEAIQKVCESFNDNSDA
jgi:hypothetical protein